MIQIPDHPVIRACERTGYQKGGMIMSDILINGMETPTDCALMLKIFPDGRVGVPVHLNWMGTMVVNDAEAVSVPPHGRLIDADALAEYVCQQSDWLSETAIHTFCGILRNAPTIIPAEPLNEEVNE